MRDVWAEIESDETGNPLHVGVDPDGTPVLLSRAVWQEHILVHHPEMREFRHLILQAITSPVEREVENDEGKFIRTYAELPIERQPSRSRLRVRVVIKYVQPPEREGRRTGLVSSAYLVRWTTR